MISLTIWVCLWLNFYVLAPPLLNINHSKSLENFTSITSNVSNTNSRILVRRRKIKQKTTTTQINVHQFDIKSYRSSWKFVDKNTIRVRFRLYETLLNSIVSTRFLAHHLHSGHIETFEKPDEKVNSTLTLYLHNIKHGRHIVCLLLYRSKLKTNPKHIFCQDIVFNFHKYGNHDSDSEEHGNTIFFLLTQYSIVLGILCILQLIHAARKRRFLRAVYDKANALRNFMIEHHHHLEENKSTTDLSQEPHALEYLIYNLNRNALHNMSTTNKDDLDNLPRFDHHRIGYEKCLNIPNPNRLRKRSTTPLLTRRRSLVTTQNKNLDGDSFDESDFDTPSYEEQSVSCKSLSHILEENKPWIAKLRHNGSIRHSVLPSEHAETTRVHSL